MIFGFQLLFAGLFWRYVFLDAFYLNPNIPFLLIMPLTTTIGTLIGCCFIKPPTLEKLMRIAFAALISIILLMLASHFIKTIWGRYRFFQLYYDHSNFNPWYIIDFFATGRSFTSAHTSAAMGIFVLLFIKHEFPKWKKFDLLIYILGGIFVTLVAYSRMVIGWHYLSDAVFAIIISGLILLVVYQLFKRKVFMPPRLYQ